MGNGIASLTDGAFLVTGEFEDSAVFGSGETNETTLTSNGDSEIFIAKYGTDGALIWAKSAGGEGSDISNDIASLPDGSALLTGRFQGAAVFGSGEANETEIICSEARCIFVAKCNADGTIAWVKSTGSPEYFDSGYGIAPLDDGSALLTGGFSGTATFGSGEANETDLSCPGQNDIFVTKYNPDGTLAWARSSKGNMSSFGYGIAALSDGSSLITGGFGGRTTFGPGEPNEIELVESFYHPSYIYDYNDIFIAKYGP